MSCSNIAQILNVGINIVLFYININHVVGSPYIVGSLQSLLFGTVTINDAIIIIKYKKKNRFKAVSRRNFFFKKVSLEFVRPTSCRVAYPLGGGGGCWQPTSDRCVKHVGPMTIRCWVAGQVDGRTNKQAEYVKVTPYAVRLYHYN